MVTPGSSTEALLEELMFFQMPLITTSGAQYLGNISVQNRPLARIFQYKIGR
jgi:hypothetical protein